jgi:hypothetical protein
VKGKVLFFCLLPLCLPLTAQAQGVIRRITFLPREFYAGDPVELRIEAEIPEGARLSLPEEPPDYGWLFIRSWTLPDRSASLGKAGSSPGMVFQEIRVEFTSFQPGIRMLPPLVLGDVVLEGIRIDTSSLLAKGNSLGYDLAPMADPLYLPKTTLFLALLAGGILGLPLLLTFLYRRLLQALQIYRLSASRRRPCQNFLQELQELDRCLLNRNGAWFYTRLLLALKNYLSQRTEHSFLPLTCREAAAYLEGVFEGREFLEPLTRLLAFSDEVKYAGRDPYTSRKKEDLELAQGVLNFMERHYREIWSSQDGAKKPKAGGESRVDR